MTLGAGSYPQKPDRPETGGEDFPGYVQYRRLIETAIDQVEAFWAALDALPDNDVQCDLGSKTCDPHNQIIGVLTSALKSLDEQNDSYQESQASSW